MSKVEVKNIAFKKSRANLFHVPKEQWDTWSATAHQVFNEVYSSMMGARDFFIHPKSVAPSKTHWRTICWNAAWTGAVATDRSIGVSDLRLQRPA